MMPHPQAEYTVRVQLLEIYNEQVTICFAICGAPASSSVCRGHKRSALVSPSVCLR